MYMCSMNSLFRVFVCLDHACADSCSHLCLLKPGGYKCACSVNESAIPCTESTNVTSKLHSFHRIHTVPFSFSVLIICLSRSSQFQWSLSAIESLLSVCFFFFTYRFLNWSRFCFVTDCKYWLLLIEKRSVLLLTSLRPIV